MKLLVVIPFCPADATLAQNLLSWIAELGSLPDNPCLLVADCKTSQAQVEAVRVAATNVFGGVTMISTPFSLPDEKWPAGANWMFETAALHVERSATPRPWLWLEPDAVPMREGWLSEIEAAYEQAAKAAKPFFGQVIKPNQAGLPAQMLSGVAVYPAKLPRAIFQRLLQTKRSIAWDVCCALMIVPLTAHSMLFWNFHNQKMPPTFVRKRTTTSPPNALEIARIPKQAALAHTCKDGSLISILRGDGEPSIGQLYMMWKMRFETTGTIGPEAAWTPSRKPLRYVHCVERHVNGDLEALRRSTEALKSWVEIYRTGRMLPCHLWDYPRSSAALGDPRHLPYLQDVLVEGMTKAGPDDVIVLTNDDTVLHGDTLRALDDKMRDVDACGSFRLNFEKGRMPGLTLPVEEVRKLGTPDLGRDLYAFRKSWLIEHWFNLPDFLLGELEWDLVVAVMIRRSAGIFTDRKNIQEPMPVCEIERGYVMHEKHEQQWVRAELKLNPAKAQNKRLAIEWYSRNSFPSLISTF